MPVRKTGRRRQNKTGALYQKCEPRYGCPPKVEGVRPKHTCKGRWFGEYEVGYDRQGRRDRRTVSAATRAEADTKLKEKLRELDRGDVPDGKRTTVRIWAEKWAEIAEKSDRPSTHTTDLSGIGWIIQAIGHRALSDLRPDDVRAVHKVIEDAGRSSSTAKRYHGVLSRMLKAAAVEGHHIPPNVFLVKSPEAAANDRDAIPTPQALALLQAATHVPQASRWIAAMLEGIRQGEALGLTWDQVTEDEIVLAWQLQALPYRIPHDQSSGFRVPRGYESTQLVGRMHLVRPKSDAGWRRIPMLPVMWKALEAWRLDMPESPHGLVWPATNGTPAGEVDDRQEWFGIQGAAMVGHPAGRYYAVHEIRHTTGTLLRALGVPEEVRIAIMGHSTIASTKTYEHVDEVLKAEMRTALERVAGELGLS